VCEPRTKEQLLALLNAGDGALYGACAGSESVLGAEACRGGDDVCEVRLFEKGLGAIGRFVGTV